MAHKSNKILVFTTAYRPLIGGSEIALEETIKRLPEFFFDIITPRYTKASPRIETGSNFKIHRIGLGSKLDKYLFPMLGFFSAHRLIEGRIIHAYQASYGAGAAWLLKTFYPKLILLVTLQEGKRLDNQKYLVRFFRKLIIKKADRVTAISRYLASYASLLNRNISIELIPNGVDIDNFTRQFSYGELTNLENKLDIKPDDKIIVSASRLVPKNGIDILIRAVAILNGSDAHSYKLILAGDGPLREEMQTLAENLGMGGSVLFVGSVNHHDLPLYLKISDVFVRPSRSEGLGSAFLEAMATGVPIVATRVGGIPDFLTDRKTGLFSTFEPDDIAFKIGIIIENEKLRQEIIKNSLELVREKYDWDNIADKFRKLYRDLSARKLSVTNFQ